MVNQIPVDGVVDQVNRALVCIEQNDLVGALYNIAPPIDVAAKKYCKPKEKNKVRIESYLERYEKELIRFSTIGFLTVTETGKVIFGRERTLAKLVYGFIRCAQSHDSVIYDSKVYLGCEFGVSAFLVGKIPPDFKPGQHVISRAFCLGLIAIVVLDPTNKRRQFKKFKLRRNQKECSLSDFNGTFGEFTDKFIEINTAQ